MGLNFATCLSSNWVDPMRIWPTSCETFAAFAVGCRIDHVHTEGLVALDERDAESLEG